MGVVEQELDRTPPDDGIRDLVDHLRERTLRQDVSLVAKYGQRLVANAHPSLGARDPAGKSVDEVRLIRDEIDRRVRALVAELVPAAV